MLGMCRPEECIYLKDCVDLKSTSTWGMCRPEEYIYLRNVSTSGIYLSFEFICFRNACTWETFLSQISFLPEEWKKKTFWGTSMYCLRDVSHYFSGMYLALMNVSTWWICLPVAVSWLPGEYIFSWGMYMIPAVCIMCRSKTCMCLWEMYLSKVKDCTCC